jgi:tRNA-specific 2-thiouridylase
VRRIAERGQAGCGRKGREPGYMFYRKGGLEKFFIDSGGLVKPGPIVDKSGKEVGTHKGIVFYTIGQRHGMGISSKVPLYVSAINAEKNEIVAGTREDIYSSSFLSWI